jgi:threonine synthase
VSGFGLRCTECGREYTEDPALLVCEACAALQRPGGPTRGVLEIELEVLPEEWPEARPSDTDFLEAFLPFSDPSAVAPLDVGGTPLLPAPRLREALDLPRLWVKDDTRNPSGSTKDRASLLVVAKASEYGFDTVAAASTGNAAAALAAVGAAAGIRAVVFVPESAPEAKLVQILCYGADVVRVQGSYDDAFDLCLASCDAFGWYNRNTALNPFTIEGKKTAALEIAAAMSPQPPDVVLVPTGDGVILAGVAKGFQDLVRAGLLPRMPRLIAVQPEGSAGIVTAFRDGTESVTPVPNAASVADSLTVGTPRNAILCLRRIRESKGGAVAVSDEEILEAIPYLASHTGVFAEPAGAAALAGLHRALEESQVASDERIVLLVTGSGLKDVPAASQTVERPEPIAPDLGAVAKLFDL